MPPHQIMHASCVAWQDRGILILGPSGSGKSGLALQLMAMGCALVADDRTQVHAAGGVVMATSSPALSGLIEARGIGILNAATIPTVQLSLVVDLSMQEHDRLPQRRVFTLLGCQIPLIYPAPVPHFAAGVLQLVKQGWSDR